MNFDDLIRKARDGENFTKGVLVRMLGYPSDSRESYQLMAEANRISKDLTGNKAEVHAQLALNIGPCPCNCAFCSFAPINGVFKDETRRDSHCGRIGGGPKRQLFRSRGGGDVSKLGILIFRWFEKKGL
jgi:hypothetical protein